MNSTQTFDPEATEADSLEKALVGVNAKTGPYLMARSWSGGRRRMVGAGGYESFCYHVISRTCGGEVFFDDVEKEALKRVMARLADFCGVKLLTYAVMGNHFHVLVEVPRQSAFVERFAGAEGEERLLSHLRILYSRGYVEALRAQIVEWRRVGMESMVQLKLKAIKERFCDLSKYVKEVKERFSRWFNKRRGRRGTLWMDRFKSVMVESGGDALRTMAAYIDLNPVRAGLVDDPKDYRWCGYAEAVSGNRRAQRGLCKAVGKPVDGWESAQAGEMYRCILFDSGREVRDAQNVNVVRTGVKVEKTKEVLKAGGKLTLGELVRQRVRYFSDGLVLGSREFVEGVFQENRAKFGPKRRDGARRMGGVETAIYSMRRLRPDKHLNR
jgi:REP element-mobilizing transposase RayT